MITFDMLQFEEASESESVDTNTSERSTLRDCVRGPGAHEMDRSSNSTGEHAEHTVELVLRIHFILMLRILKLL